MLRSALLAFFCCILTLAQSQTSDLADLPPFAPEYVESVCALMRSFEAASHPAPDPAIVPEWQQWSTVENFAFGKNRGAMAMITDLDALHPYFREKVTALIEACRAKGIELAIVETFRTRAKQNEYRSMGRIYTRSNGGKSKHQYGLAIDVVPIVDSVATWHDPVIWKKVGTAGERLGLRWGGRWRHPYDPGHFEWTGGTSTAMLEHGIFPRVPNAEVYPCIDEELEDLKISWEAWEAEQAAIAEVRKASKNAMR